LKSNRLLNGVQVRDHNQRLKHRRYDRVTVTAADEERPRTYLVRSLTGKLSSLPEEVRVYISKKHNGDTRSLLEEACRMVLQVGNIPTVLVRFTLAPPRFD
jgi:hypothetical protein